MFDIFNFANIANWFKYNIWWLGILFVLLIVVVLLFRLNKKPKKTIRNEVNDESLNHYIDAYGGIDNIKQADLDGRRLKVSIKKLETLDLDAFKSLGATGIFISGHNIKMVLPYDMQKLVNKINDSIDGGKK